MSWSQVRAPDISPIPGNSSVAHRRGGALKAERPAPIRSGPFLHWHPWQGACEVLQRRPPPAYNRSPVSQCESSEARKATIEAMS